MAKTYKGKSKEEKKLEIETLIKNAEDKIENYCKTPQEIKELVDFMSRFYNYSLRNSVLINEQFNGAIAVGSFAFWKEKGFQVKKGEKGIKILVPTNLGDRFENEKGEVVLYSKATNLEKEKAKKGELKFIEGRTVFKQGYVFDISQTNAKNTDLPKIFPNRWLEGNVENYEVLYNGLVKIADNNGIKIIEPKGELGTAIYIY